MEFGICIPHYGKPLDVAKILETVRHAEGLGFDSVWVTDHILVPQTLDIIYRDNMLEPLALLNYVAAITQRVKIGTSVVILPYRHPVVVAKMLATTDYLSGGRLIFGAAVGWMEPEFAALNAPFAERGAFSDECLRLIKTLWLNEKVSFTGRYFTFQDMQASPRPVQQPHPPIWIGGNSPRARRRVAELGNGWHASSMPYEALRAGIADVRAKWERQGRDGEPILSMRIPCFIEGISQAAVHYPDRPGRDKLVGNSTAIVERLGAYQELGLRHVILEMSTQSHQATLATLEHIATQIRPQLSS
ncbi:MAG TPA: LLM class F420-dependent oxidoreductase [Alphaproteobacteria bacterium]|nr:LLM class F420-dependent oxidoreductase [Alphaproteobacteria bacterium]